MIDNFSLGITHALMLLVAVLLLMRSDLDREGPAPDDKPPKRNRGRRDA